MTSAEANDPFVTALTAAAVGGDAEALRSVLADDVVWADCHGPDAVVAMFRSMRNNGMGATSLVAETLPDRVAVTLDVTIDDAKADFHMALLTRDELITDILLASDANDARTITPEPEPAPAVGRARFGRVAPIFAVADIESAATHYRTLGFEVEAYDGPAAYGFATRDGIEIHLAGHAGIDPLTTTSATYIWVDDANLLHAEWVNSGIGGRFRRPESTDYGLLEGAHIDPWGNLIRYGSPS